MCLRHIFQNIQLPFVYFFPPPPPPAPSLFRETKIKSDYFLFLILDGKIKIKIISEESDSFCSRYSYSFKNVKIIKNNY